MISSCVLGFTGTATAQTDTTVPTIAISSPASNAQLSSLSAISGTATDPGTAASGVQSVEVRFYRDYMDPNNPEYWTGSQWTAQSLLAGIAQTVTVNGPAGNSTQNWSLSSLPTSLDPSRYKVQVRARDNAGNWSGWSSPRTISIKFSDGTVDQTLPTGTIDSPVNNTTTNPTITDTGTWNGKASDGATGSGIGRVEVLLLKSSGGVNLRWDPDAAQWTTNDVYKLGALGTADANGQRLWTFNPATAYAHLPSTTDFAPGLYSILIRAYDKFANSVSVQNTIRVLPVDTVPPQGNISSPASGPVATLTGSLSGAAWDPDTQVGQPGSGVRDVRLKLGQDWTGTDLFWNPNLTTPGWDASGVTTYAVKGTADAQNYLTWTASGVSVPSGSAAPRGRYFYQLEVLDNYNLKTTYKHYVYLGDSDSSAPSVAITYPANNSSISRLLSLSGTASDETGGSGLARVDVQLIRWLPGSGGTTTKQWWSGTSWGTTAKTFTTLQPASPDGQFNWSVTSGLPTGTNLTNCQHQVLVTATDRYGNTTAGTTSTFNLVTNTAPSAIGQNVSTAYNTAKAITLSAPDAEGDPVIFNVLTQPAHGTLSGTAPNLTYMPAVNYSGSDNFTFNGQDYGLTSATVTVSITVDPRFNSAPTAIGQSVPVQYNTAKAIALSATDQEQDPLTYSYTNPSHGSLSGTAPNLTYTPATNYHGPDTFTFTASDYGLTSAAATVSITVADRSNTAPRAKDLPLQTTAFNTEFILNFAADDDEGDPVTFNPVTPAHGTVTFTDGHWVYTPAHNYFGDDTFTYTASDFALTGPPATVNVHVSAAPYVDLLAKLAPDGEYVGDDIANTDGAGQTVTAAETAGNTVIYYVKLQKVSEDGSVSVVVKAPAAPEGWTVQYLNGLTGAEVIPLNEITGDGWVVAVNEDTYLRVLVMAPDTVTTTSTFTLLVTAAPQGDSDTGHSDAVKMATVARSALHPNLEIKGDAAEATYLDAAAPNATGLDQTVEQGVSYTQLKRTFYVKVREQNGIAGTIAVKGLDEAEDLGWTISYYDGDILVSDAVKSDDGYPVVLEANGEHVIRVEITASTDANADYTQLVSGSADGNQDTVGASVNPDGLTIHPDLEIKPDNEAAPYVGENIRSDDGTDETVLENVTYDAWTQCRKYLVKVKERDGLPGPVVVRAPAGGGAGLAGWAIRYWDGPSDVTNNVTGVAGYTVNLGEAADHVLKAEVAATNYVQDDAAILVTGSCRDQSDTVKVNQVLPQFIKYLEYSVDEGLTWTRAPGPNDAPAAIVQAASISVRAQPGKSGPWPASLPIWTDPAGGASPVLGSQTSTLYERPTGLTPTGEVSVNTITARCGNALPLRVQVVPLLELEAWTEEDAVELENGVAITQAVALTTDALGNPQAGITVHFSLNGTPGEINEAGTQDDVATTNADGIAVVQLRLVQHGTVTVTASAEAGTLQTTGPATTEVNVQ